MIYNNILIYHFRYCLKISHRHKRTLYKYCLNEYLIYKHNIYNVIYIYDLNNNILIYHFRFCLKISQRHKRKGYLK